jgi:hypothetical protein
MGGSTSAGNRRTAPATLSRMSLAAASTSAPMANSTRIALCPSREVEAMLRTPATPFTACSSGSVICESMTSGLAPG